MSSPTMPTNQPADPPLADTIARPFLSGITAPTEEEWEMLFEDAKRSNAKQVIANNPGISYSTFCSRMARWDKGERGPATKAISARGRRGRPRSSGFRTPGSKRKRVSSDEDDEDDEEGSEGEFSRGRRSSNVVGSPPTLEQSSRSAFHPFGAVGPSPFAMGHVSLTANTTKPSVLTCLAEVESQLTAEIYAAAKTMRETGGWLAKSNSLIDQLEAKEIAQLQEEIEAARTAVEQVRKLRGESS